MAAFQHIIRDEIAVINDAIPVYERDARQGYHIEAKAHMVTPGLMREKRQELERYLNKTA